MIWNMHVAYALMLSLAVRRVDLSGEVVFRCPSCSAERQAECPEMTGSCAEVVREPGCGCCPVCARRLGELCGVYTPRCSSGLRCYPEPGSDLPLEQLVQGLGICGRRVEAEPTGGPERRESSVQVQDLMEGAQTEVPTIKRPPKDSPWGGAKKAAMWLHRQEMKSKMKLSKVDDGKSPCLKPAGQTQCQQELDQALERISKMPFSETRGPLEDLYAVHIPNCDKKGQYNMKQCKMSVAGQRGECWCVNPYTGRQIPDSPMVRGNPNCSQYLGGLEIEPPTPLRK
ncbi:insulin-like growth factor-binding protein 2-A isoform X1 [Paramormyrops kingsleyae]|uniref:Insulin like growth factor binding protein 2 n=2 Tax=Paramormyrops kingsleyae TaxID=1676925 RepID=A0A3B3SVN4_9TELE|nr:insulin-like growth factor-binding protein 2-A isoform X1 [Paramormyrops kingsleyae]